MLFTMMEDDFRLNRMRKAKMKQGNLRFIFSCYVFLLYF